MSKTELPEAYRIGWVPFIHTNIWLDSRPLIPRPETEYWVDLAIKEIKASRIPNPKVLDLCAGSGCIGVTVLKEIPEARVDFVEVEEKHHPTIAKNIRLNGLDEARARIFGGNLFENITGKYDFILSNPPYVDQSLNRVEKSVKSHEPALALYGGAQGMEIINRILAQYQNYLCPRGALYLEHEPEQTPFMSDGQTFKDQFGLDRFSKFALV